MKRIVFGDKRSFAIEIEVLELHPLFGRLCIWLDGLWLGDFNRSMFLFHAIDTFEILSSLANNYCVYDNADAVPSIDELIDRGNWSIGESFDDFVMIYYITLHNDSIHFVWSMRSTSLSTFPTYPIGRFHTEILLEYYRDTICKLREYINSVSD